MGETAFIPIIIRNPPYSLDWTVPQKREEERGNSESFSALSA
jgi:hypothetical protein